MAQTVASTEGGSWSARTVVVAVVLALLEAIVYAPVAHHDFVNLDDPVYFSSNPHVLGGLSSAGIAWSFQAGYTGNWHPVTWFSHMMDAQFFGHGPAGPHLVNLALHIANSLMVFGFLRIATGAFWRPAMVAALFGLHPLHVESVAWIAERKDVLSGFFFLLTLWFYCRRFSGVGKKNSPTWRWAALLSFALGLASKPMLVTTPFVLLLLDRWALQRVSKVTFKNLILEKIPYFALAFGSCIIAFLAQKKGGAVQNLSNCPLSVRLENAVVSCVLYIGKTFWPSHLATPYSDTHAWPMASVVMVIALLLVVTLIFKKWDVACPFQLMGWLWFLGMLVPVIGIVQVGAQAMADRYTYLPSIGLFIAMVWGVREFLCRMKMPVEVGAVIAAALIIIMCCMTRTQLGYWKNSEALLGHAITVTKDNWLAEYNLGWELARKGDSREAAFHYREAYRVHPEDFDIENNLGRTLSKLGNYGEAVPLFEAALQQKPDFADSHYNLANALLHEEKFDRAIVEYKIFLRQKPEHTAALSELGVAYAGTGDYTNAIRTLQEAVRLAPDDAEIHVNLAAAFELQGNVTEAKTHYLSALKCRPGWKKAEDALKALESAAR